MELPDHLVQGVVKPHLEDSMALAEHLNSFDVEQLLKRLGPCKTPSSFLTRAWIYNEYALATVETDDDDRYFTMGRDDLMQILDNKELPSRHPIRLNAAMLLAYEPAFRARANSEDIGQETRDDLQKSLGDLMLDFIDGPEITKVQYGPLAELIVSSYLLNGDLFPYLASRREEANMIVADNHDIYTLHPCAKNRIKKAPASIKYRERLADNPLMVNITLADMALATAASVPPYDQDESLRWVDSAKGTMAEGAVANCATKLAADIMICKTQGEALSVEDQAFLWNLSARLQAPLVAFANLDTTPDYASNAQALRKEIMTREAHAKAVQAAIKAGTAVDGLYE